MTIRFDEFPMKPIGYSRRRTSRPSTDHHMVGACDLNGSQSRYSMEHIHHESNYFILLQHKSICVGGQWPQQLLHCCAERSCMSNRSCCCTPWRRTCGVNLPCFMRVNHAMEQRSKALVTAAPWKDAGSSTMDKERAPSCRTCP